MVARVTQVQGLLTGLPHPHAIAVETTLALISLDEGATVAQVQWPPTDLPILKPLMILRVFSSAKKKKKKIGT
jgi:hypothetical protein